METLETTRLRAEPISEDHRFLVRRMFQNEQVCATLGGVLSDEDADRALRRNLDHWDQHGFGIWHFFDRQSDGFLGRAGLRHHEAEVELSYTVMPEYWNCGFATEMSRAVLQSGFELVRLTEVISFTLPTNIASQRVMKKLGFEFEHDGVHAELPHVFYRLTADRFREQSQR